MQDARPAFLFCLYIRRELFGGLKGKVDIWEMKLLKNLIEFIFWIQIFLAPVILFAIIAFFIFVSNEEYFILSIIILLAGCALGIWCAEWIRKKYGCSKYIGRLLGTPELENKKNKS